MYNKDVSGVASTECGFPFTEMVSLSAIVQLSIIRPSGTFHQATVNDQDQEAHERGKAFPLPPSDVDDAVLAGTMLVGSGVAVTVLPDPPA
jgi:hypothetical protein